VVAPDSIGRHRWRVPAFPAGSHRPDSEALSTLWSWTWPFPQLF